MIKSYERLKKQNKERIRVPRTVQDTIPVDLVYKDGIFRSGNRYTKSYRFLDINYKIASGEDKNNLFVYDGNDITIYDGLVKDAPDYIFKYGEIFSVVTYEDLNLIDGIISRKNFNLLNNKNTYRKEEKYLCGQK